MGRIKSVLEIVAERHHEWHYMTMAFGCNKDTAEDIVQDMYLRINKIIQNGTDIMYNETEVNAYYILKTLKSIFLDKIRKEKNYIEVDYDYSAYNIEIDFDNAHDKIQKELKKLYWFDSKVFDIINSGEKISELSKKTTIPYYTLYNTYKKVYNHLKKFI